MPSHWASRLKSPLLFLCHRIPFPPNKGDKIRSFHLLRHLSKDYDIYLATFVDDPDDWQWIPELEKYCKDSVFVELKPSMAKVRSLSSFVSGKPLSLPYYSSSQLQKWIDGKITEFSISHLLVYSAVMSQFVMQGNFDFDRKILDFVDIDSDKWSQYSSQKPWPLSWLYRREGRLLLEAEREAASFFDASLFVSSAEADMFRTLVPENTSKIGFYNNGVDAAYFNPKIVLDNPYTDNQQVLVFTGAMDYWPNVDAVTWFAEEVFSELKLREPGLCFYIVGSNPTSAVTQLGLLDGVTVTGRVEDVRPYIKHAIASVAPMRIARGIQNKVLEAMAMEKIVIVSAKGLEGIQATNGEHVLVADSISEVRECVLRVINGNYLDIGGNARSKICRLFSWEESLPEVANLLSVTSSSEEQESVGV